MTKKERNKAILIFSVIALVFMVGSILTGGGGGEEESIQTVMRDAVMHDVNKVSLFGIKDVNPALISGFMQVMTTSGHPISLPAPMADVNGAIMMGCLSYLVIMSGGIVGNGVKGIGKTLKDFSLPLSLSFRLFGALISGALVTELVYYYTAMSYVVPVIVGVLFTLLHALIQAYVLTMLTSLFYGEVSEKVVKPPKEKRRGKKRVTVVKEQSV